MNTYLVKVKLIATEIRDNIIEFSSEKIETILSANSANLVSSIMIRTKFSPEELAVEIEKQARDEFGGEDAVIGSCEIEIFSGTMDGINFITKEKINEIKFNLPIPEPVEPAAEDASK